MFNSAHRRRRYGASSALCVLSEAGSPPAAAPGHAPGNDTDEAEEKGSETWKIYSLICRCDGGDGGEAEVK